MTMMNPRPILSIPQIGLHYVGLVALGGPPFFSAFTFAATPYQWSILVCLNPLPPTAAFASSKLGLGLVVLNCCAVVDGFKPSSPVSQDLGPLPRSRNTRLGVSFVPCGPAIDHLGGHIQSLPNLVHRPATAQQQPTPRRRLSHHLDHSLRYHDATTHPNNSITRYAASRVKEQQHC